MYVQALNRESQSSIVQHGQTALMWAARYGKEDIMKYLVENVNATDNVRHNNYALTYSNNT